MRTYDKYIAAISFRHGKEFSCPPHDVTVFLSAVKDRE